jgi:hypothetical protein
MVENDGLDVDQEPLPGLLMFTEQLVRYSMVWLTHSPHSPWKITPSV